MVKKIEDLFIEISSNSNSELNFIPGIRNAGIILLLAFLTLFNFKFFFFKVSATTITKLKAIIPMLFISVISSYTIIRIRINKNFKELVFLNDLYEIIKNEPDPTKDELVEILRLIDKYEEDFKRNKLSTKGLRYTIFFYADIFFNMSKKEFLKYYEEQNLLLKNKSIPYDQYKPIVGDYSKDYLYKYLLKKRLYNKDKKVEKYLKEFLVENLNNNMFSMEEVINIYINNEKENDFILESIKSSNIYSLIKNDLIYIDKIKEEDF